MHLLLLIAVDYLFCSDELQHGRFEEEDDNRMTTYKYQHVHRLECAAIWLDRHTWSVKTLSQARTIGDRVVDSLRMLVFTHETQLFVYN